MGDFKKLVVWQKAHAMTLHAHRLAIGIRPAFYAPVRSQLVRAAMSIPANIVEGARQESNRDFARFIRYAINSACELEYHVMLARDMGVIPDKDGSSLLSELIEVRRMLHGLLIAVRNDKPAQSRADDTVSREGSPLPADKA
ncbi:MAG: four helix bundle protein [Gemmatimonadales bacterium]